MITPLKRVAFFILALLACYVPSTAQQLSLSGQIRPRTEYLHGFSTLMEQTDDPALFTLQRSRLNLYYQQQDYEVKFVLQDIRTWGNTSQLNVTDGSFSVHEAWAKLKLSDKLGIKVGRQEIAYDDQRIFGSVNWAQQARSHDALLVTLEDSTFKFHIGLAYNQNGPSLVNNPYVIANNYKTLQYLWFQKKWNRVDWSILALNNGVQVVTLTDQFVSFSQTIGTRLKLKGQKLAGGFNFYYQTGKTGDASETEISAFNVRASLTAKLSKKFHATIGGELLSGNDQTDPNNQNNAFTPFYGTNHKFNGLMDYFYVGNHIGNVGLRDFFAGIKVISKKITISSDLHLFQTAGTLVDGNASEADATLGAELDIYAQTKLKPQVSLKFGYSQLFATSSMETLKGTLNPASTQNWAWVMIDFTPVFFKGKIKKNK